MQAGTNRVQKVGVAYEVEKKLEQNYDREEAAGTPTHIINWMNAICDGEHDPIPNTDWKGFNTHLKDGVMLCKLINKLLKADGKSPIQFQKKVMSPFVAMTNIENFNKGCESYGLAKEFTFQSGDLVELRKAGFFNTLNCLSSLGMLISMIAKDKKINNTESMPTRNQFSLHTKEKYESILTENKQTRRKFHRNIKER